MENKENKSAEQVKTSRTELIALVAAQIKGKILFPKQVEEARKMLDRARIVKNK